MPYGVIGGVVEECSKIVTVIGDPELVSRNV
jgi:hypothetical protein